MVMAGRGKRKRKGLTTRREGSGTLNMGMREGRGNCKTVAKRRKKEGGTPDERRGEKGRTI